MSKEDGTIQIQPVAGEAMRFLCSSWSHPKQPHLVDLSENQGNGCCSCIDYTTRRGPAIKAGADLFTRATSCRHLIAVRKYWAMTTLRDIAAHIKNQERPPKYRRPEPAPTPQPETKPTRKPYEGYC